MVREDVVKGAHWRESASLEVLAELELDNLASLQESLFDVAIVGGGIAGLSAAAAASALGAKVVVLERSDRLGTGATGQNAGIVSAGVNTPLVNMPPDSPAERLWTATSNLIPELYARSENADSPLDAKKTGALSLARSKAALNRLRAEARARKAFGLNAEIVSKAECAKKSSELLDLSDVEGGLWLPDEGRVHPLSLLADFAKQARPNATLIGSARVEGLRASGSHWLLDISGSQQRVRARSVLRTIGPIVHPTARIYALAFRCEMPENFPDFWDAAPYTYYDYRAGHGFLTVSGGPYGSALLDTSTPSSIKSELAFHQKMARETKRWLPALANDEPSHAWGVNLEVTADLMPTISRLKSFEQSGVSAAPLESADRALAIDGLGSLGVLPGIILGREAATHLIGSLS